MSEHFYYKNPTSSHYQISSTLQLLKMEKLFKLLVSLTVMASLASANLDMACFKLPNNKHPLECCNEPKLFPGETFAKCAALYPPPPMPPPSGKLKGCVSQVTFLNYRISTAMCHPQKCMSECVLNETKINVNGMPNGEKAIAIIDEKMDKDPDFMPVVTNAINECGAALKDYQGMFDEMMKNQVDDGEKVCHPQSGFMIGCFYGSVFSNCPAKRWTSSTLKGRVPFLNVPDFCAISDAECDAIKQHVTKCHFLLPQLNK
jgi:hypothetical protein